MFRPLGTTYSWCMPLLIVLGVSVAPGRAQPSLVSFSLTLTPPEFLILTFDTDLQDSSCDVSKLTLQNSSTLIIEGAYSPQEGSCSLFGGLTTILNTGLSSSDWEAIQAHLYLATDSTNAYLSMQAGFLTGDSNIPISSSAALQVTSSLFSANINPPLVVGALLDLDAGVMTLRLYEGSRYSASAPVNFIDSTGSGGEITLTNFSTPNNVEFFYILPDFLQASLKLASPPFSVSLPAALFMDGGGMTSPAQSALALTLIPDTTAPEIIAFAFDLDEGQLDLTFNEPIDLDSVDLTKVYLTSNFHGSQDGVSIDSGVLLASGDLNTELSVFVNTSTLHSVKYDTTLCINAANCLLNINSSAFSDTSGNNIPSSPSNIIAHNVISDTTAPRLLSYSINLESSSVALTFDEPVNPSTFNPFGVTLDIDVMTSGDDPVQYQSVPLGGASSIVGIVERGTVIRVELETTALIDLKVLISSGYPITCTIEDFTVQDTSGNLVIPIPPSTSFHPNQIIIDQTPPTLLDFTASPPAARQLTFVFSEAVNVSTWNVSALILTLLTPQESYNYTFSDGTVGADAANTVIFTIDNSEYVFSSLMEHYQEAYVSGSLAVTTRGALIEDVFGNALEPVIHPLLFNATPSEETPELLTVDFDLNSGTLHLMFSDVVVISFPAGRIRFQDRQYLPTHVLTLSNNGSYTSLNKVESSFSLVLDTEDLNGLKLNPFLATSATNTFVVLAEDFAYSLDSIPIVQQNGTAVQTFTPDTGDPEVIRFELDLDSDILSIEFSEPVPVHTFDESHIVLINSSTLPLSDVARVTLTGTFTLARDNVTSLRALISIDDIIDIKRQPLCYSSENCYVVFDEALVSDVSGNVFLPTNTPMQVDSVSPDVTPPQLENFPIFDLDSGLFTLIFTEPVNGSSTDYTDVQFNNAPINFNASVTLSEGFTSPDHIEIDFHLSREDLNRLKNIPNLCTSRDDCWIRLPSFFITDIGMNPFIHSDYLSDVAASFHQPSDFIPDQTSPELEYASIDLNQGTLTLSFSEVIFEATFSPDDVTLISSPSSTLSLTLSADTSFTLTSFNSEVHLQLTTNDLNWLKAQDLFTSVSDSYLSIASNLIDISGNVFQNISSTLGFQVNEVIPDRTGPRLVSFDYFNLENNSFTMTFDEPINVLSFNATQVVLVSHRSGFVTYQLTGAALISALDNSLQSVMVVISNVDRVQIKLLNGLATMRSNTYIALGENAIADTSGNMNQVVPIGLAIPLSTGGYIQDTSRASLTGFGLDLDSSRLYLTFNDVVASGSIDLSSLTIQNKASSPTSFVALSHTSIPLNGDSDQITILLSQGDLFALQLDLSLARSADDTYISIDSNFISDIEGRAINSILPTSALPITSSFIPDTTSPSLSSFSLDMDTGTMLLNFTEPILVSSVDPSQISLHGQSTGAGPSLTLRQSTLLLSPAVASLEIELKLDQSDLNYLKNAPDLAVGTRTTFMSFTSGLLTDVSNNSIEAVASNSSIAAFAFTIDTTAPELIGFDADISPVAKIYLTFSETVRLSGMIQNTVSLTNARVNPSVSISLTEADESNQTDLDLVEISLSPPVITQLLVDDTIARSVDFLYLSLMVGVVTDTNRNNIIPVTAYRVEHLYKSCFSNTYNNESLGECVECPSECGGSCTGPDTTVGSGGCDSCSVVELDGKGNQLSCADPTMSTCRLGFFSTSLSSLTSSLPPAITESTLLCQQCDSLCSSCDGPSASDCQTCRSAFFTNTSTNSARVECIKSCDQTSASDCTACHIQCDGCRGPSNRDCVTCREECVTIEGETVCVPLCTGNTYLSLSNGVHMCQQCHEECVGCYGSTNTHCVKCRNTNFTTNGLSMCLASCPSGYYDQEGSCTPCHEYCINCTGPSNKNCTSCVDDEVEGQDGERICVPSCAFGHEYDTQDEKCVLSRVAIILIVAACAVGVTIVGLVNVLGLCTYCYHLRRKKKNQGVFSFSVNYNTHGNELWALN